MKSNHSDSLCEWLCHYEFSNMVRSSLLCNPLQGTQTFHGMLSILSGSSRNQMEGRLKSPCDKSTPLPNKNIFQNPKVPATVSGQFLQTMESRLSFISLVPAEGFFISKPDIKASQIKKS